MENNQDELQQEEIPNIEQFQVGRIPAEENDQQTGPENSGQDDDDVELGFTEDEPEGEDVDPEDDQQDTEGEAGDENADFESPTDDPA